MTFKLAGLDIVMQPAITKWGFEDLLARMTTRQMRTLYQIAKHPKKGARPFFADPKAMIELRQEIARRETP